MVIIMMVINLFLDDYNGDKSMYQRYIYHNDDYNDDENDDYDDDDNDDYTMLV